MAATATALAVFGTLEQAADFVKKFDWSKMDVKDSTRDDYLHLLLAPSFGGLNSNSIKELDDQLKIAIAGTMQALAKIPPQQRSWDKILEVMIQNPLLQPEEVGISRADKIVKEEITVFNGSPDQNIVREVQSWFINLIQDDDVLKSTAIDIKVMANIVAQTGATIYSFLALIYKNELHEKNMVDIGVIRFPDIDHPHFKLYRIKLFAWSDSRRTFFLQKDTNGITGEFNCRIFHPRASVIQELPMTIKMQAIKEAEDLFAGPVQHHNTQAERFGADAEEEEDGFVWRDVHTEDGTPYQVGYLKTDSAHLVEMPEPPSAGALNLNNAETKWFRVNWNVSTDGSETVFTDFVDFDTPAFPNLKKYRLFKQSWSYWTYRLEFEVSAAGSPRIYRFKSGGVEFQRTPLWATTWALRYNSDSEMISHLGRKFIP